MSHNQLEPLEVNSRTNEPFLRLRRHPNVVITPPRWDDADKIVPVLNDFRVAEWVLNPPFPYLKEHADGWLGIAVPLREKALAEIQAAQGLNTLKLARDCPVSAIREIQEDGTDMFIGDISLGRCLGNELLEAHLPGWEKLSKAENAALEVGDSRIIWTIGDYLAPSHHGKGIMSDAIETLIHEWAIPRINVCKILVGAFAENIASQRVFEKNGFELLSQHNVKSEVRGKGRLMTVMGWKRGEI